ncbi:MAG: tRNA 2-thiouridine(34) synthase MnmA [Arenicellales bacterium]|nr:tRNA 2-thiouridine(34) synthase MnmA [Arenicellales bacterium]
MSHLSEHVVVGLSGGVDSAVAAALLLEQGYEVTGLFMKNWEDDDDDEYCAAAVDLSDAESVCSILGIELRTINFSYEYWERVFTQFLDQYESGYTPNPDILCNREIKFKEFLEYAKTLGADHIATGHYVGVRQNGNKTLLLRGRDAAKDQSYFLYALNQTALKQSLFPLFAWSKAEVREKARRLGLSVYDKKDSTGICFIGERRFKDFLRNYIDSNKGQIRDLDETVVGEHDGLVFYTLGQRQGLGIGGAGEPWYVVRKDMACNVLYVTQGHEHPALFSSWLHANELNWISGSTPSVPITCTAKTRYRQADQDCTIESIANGRTLVRFGQPQRAVTPGQSVVFYDGDTCLGGGTIVTCEALVQTGDNTLFHNAKEKLSPKHEARKDY